MEHNKLLKLQKKYTPERCLNLKGNTVLLSDRLYVPNEFVDDDMMEAYTTKLGVIEVERDEYGDEVEVEKEIHGFKEYPKVTAFHRGDLGKIDLTFAVELEEAGARILDIRSKPKMLNDISFTGQLRKDQKRVIKEWCDYGYGIIKAPPRYGKCIVGDSLVNTGKGLFYIENICGHLPEDVVSQENTPEVFNRYGDKVSASHIFRGRKSKTYKFRTYCGYSEEGTYEHPVLVLTPDMEMVWKRLGDLKYGDKVAISTKLDFPTELVKLPRPLVNKRSTDITLPEYCDRSLARLLGYLVAEGSLSFFPRWRFTNKHQQFALSFWKTFNKCFPDYNDKLSVDIAQPKNKGTFEFQGCSKVLTDFFELIGLGSGGSGSKNIPWCILQSPKHIVKEFLRGYFEGDGWNDHCGIQCCSKSKKLIKEIQILLLSFGIISKRRRKSIPDGVYWTLCISNQYANLFQKEIGFLSARKNNAYLKNRNKEWGTVIKGSYSYLFKEVLSKSLGSGVYLVNNKRSVLKISPNKGGVDFKLSQLTPEILNNIGKVSAPCAERFRELLRHKHIVWDEVVFHKKSNRLKNVYDLTVPDSHSFVANGIVNHNTITLCGLLSKLRTRTLVVVHQNELIKQFKKALKNFTNAFDFDNGVSVISRRNLKDMDTHDVCIVTWQLLNSKNGKKVLRKYRNAFGLVIVDECFPYETPVLVDYNTSLPIGDVIANKKITHVLSYDLESKKIIKKKIVRRITKEFTGWMYDIFIGQNKVSCSPNHKFILKGGKEVKAEDLRVGNTVITYDDYFSQSYSCEVCGKLFSSVPELTMHKYKDHPSSKSNKVKCEICGEKVHKFHIGYHIAAHDEKFVEEVSKTCSKKRIKYLKTEKGQKDIENLKNNRKGINNPLYKGKTKKQTSDIKKRISESRKEWFNSLSEEEFNRRVSIFMKAPNYNNHPNICERNIIDLKIKNLKFTGDGTYFVTFKDKKKNPDFIATNCLSKNGRSRKVVEIMDFEYWHTKQEANSIKRQYKRLGIDCLIIDAKECYKEEDLIQVKAKIESFINNHFVKITRIKKTLVKKPKLLYNLEVEGTHNYFVVADTLRDGRKREQMGWKPTKHRPQDVPFDNENLKRIPILVSNCHKAAAPCFKNVVSKFNSYYRCGCTATDKRKDMMEAVVYDVIGPVVTKGRMKKVPVDVYIHRTEFDPQLKGHFFWNTLEKRLGSSKSRNEMICKHIKEDIKSSRFHYGVVATRPVFHVKLLVKKLNKMGIPTAGFWGGAPNRDKLLEDMVAGKYRVIVANRQMLLGINVPRWTHFYNCMPSSNAPNYYQEMSRVRTPHTVTLRNRKTGEVKTWEKKVAVVRDYLDDFGPCYGCMNTRRGVYDKDKKVTIRSTQKPNEKDPTCGMCKNFEKCIGYGKSIKNDTHVCHRFSQRKKRTLGSRRD